MSFGWAGVDLFFVLSGFLITGILLDTRQARNRGVSFYGRRALRILPLYYALVFGCIVIALVLRNSWSIRDHWPDTMGWLSYICYLENWWMPLKEFARSRPLGHFWSLAVEEQFYLLWPMCVWLMPRRYLAPMCGFGCVCALLLRWMLSHYGVSGWFIYENTFTRMDPLLMGAFCAIAIRDAQLLLLVRRLLPFVGFGAFGAFASLAFLLRKSEGYDYWLHIFGFSLLACVGAVFVLGAYLCQGTNSFAERSLRSRILKSFGKYSYGIYVYQSLVQAFVIYAFASRRWWGHSVKYAAVVAAFRLLLSFLTAFVSFHLFESKFQRLKSHFTPETYRSTQTEPVAGIGKAVTR